MKLAKYVKFREEKFGGVLFETRSEKVFTLNPTATAVVREIQAGSAERDIPARLKECFNDRGGAIDPTPSRALARRERLGDARMGRNGTSFARRSASRPATRSMPLRIQRDPKLLRRLLTRMSTSLFSGPGRARGLGDAASGALSCIASAMSFGEPVRGRSRKTR